MAARTYCFHVLIVGLHSLIQFKLETRRDRAHVAPGHEIPSITTLSSGTEQQYGDARSPHTIYNSESGLSLLFLTLTSILCCQTAMQVRHRYNSNRDARCRKCVTPVSRSELYTSICSRYGWPELTITQVQNKTFKQLISLQSQPQQSRTPKTIRSKHVQSQLNIYSFSSSTPSEYVALLAPFHIGNGQRSLNGSNISLRSKSDVNRSSPICSGIFVHSSTTWTDLQYLPPGSPPTCFLL